MVYLLDGFHFGVSISRSQALAAPLPSERTEQCHDKRGAQTCALKAVVSGKFVLVCLDSLSLVFARSEDFI